MWIRIRIRGSPYERGGSGSDWRNERVPNGSESEFSLCCLKFFSVKDVKGTQNVFFVFLFMSLLFTYIKDESNFFEEKNMIFLLFWLFFYATLSRSGSMFPEVDPDLGKLSGSGWNRPN